MEYITEETINTIREYVDFAREQQTTLNQDLLEALNQILSFCDRRYMCKKFDEGFTYDRDKYFEIPDDDFFILGKIGIHSQNTEHTDYEYTKIIRHMEQITQKSIIAVQKYIDLAQAGKVILPHNLFEVLVQILSFCERRYMRYIGVIGPIYDANKFFETSDRSCYNNMRLLGASCRR